MSKSSKVKAIPKGYHNVTPYLIIDGAARALEYYQRVFGATERMRMPGPDGKIGHAEISIGDSSLMLYVNDVDATVKTAVAEGAKVLQPVEDKFYGDRMGTIEDPFGHHWHIGTHKEDVPPEELKRRAAEMAKSS